MNLQDVLAKLQSVKKCGDYYSARCPAHDDSRNSLKVKAGDKQVFFDCYAGCAEDEISSALALTAADLFFEPLQTSSNAKRQIAAVYDYRDEQGELLYQNVRYEPKDFRQRKPDGANGWTYKLNGTRRVPYRLPELVAALKETPSRFVLLTEGEKDADNLRAAGFTATSFKQWRNEFNSFIQSANVALLIDHDKSGVRQAADAAQIISEAAATVRLIDLFNDEPLPDKHGRDVSDWLADGHTADKLQTIIKNAVPFAASANDQINEPPANSTSETKPLRAVNLANVQPEKVSWLWKPFIAFGAFTIVDGEEGIGKSLMILAIGCAVATGKGFDTIEGFEMVESAATERNVLLLSAEESLSFVVKPRLMALGAPCEKFIAIDESFTFNREGFLRLEMAIAEYAPALVVVDPLFSYTGETKLNDDNSIRQVTGELIRIAERYQTAIVGVRHIGKSKGFGDPRAAGLNGVGWRASARSALLVGKDPNTGELAVCQNKNNLAPKSRKSYGFKIETAFVEVGDGEQIEVGKFHWTGESKLTEKEMLSAAGDTNERAEQSEAVALLEELLRDGEREAKEVENEAKRFGITEKPLRNARTKLGITIENGTIRRVGSNTEKNQKTYWRLPSTDARTDAHTKGNGQVWTNSGIKTSYSNDLATDAQNQNNGQVWTQNGQVWENGTPEDAEEF